MSHSAAELQAAADLPLHSAAVLQGLPDSAASVVSAARLVAGVAG